MKLILTTLLVLTFAAPIKWLTNFNEAKEEAVKSDKYILVNFSGSDWCIPCIKMEKQIFEDEAFTSFADKNLLLVRADFPRLKKHHLSKEQTLMNEQLAEVYNPNGKFPYTLLLDKYGKVVKEWEGFPSDNAETFVSNINNLIHAAD